MRLEPAVTPEAASGDVPLSHPEIELAILRVVGAGLLVVSGFFHEIGESWTASERLQCRLACHPLRLPESLLDSLRQCVESLIRLPQRTVGASYIKAYEGQRQACVLRLLKVMESLFIMPGGAVGNS